MFLGWWLRDTRPVVVSRQVCPRYFAVMKVRLKLLLICSRTLQIRELTEKLSLRRNLQL